MSIISPTHSSSHCFAGLMKLYYDPSKPYKERLSSNKGVHVTWYGNTSDTLEESHCGFHAIQNLIPYGHHLNTKATLGYYYLHKSLELMGY